MIFSGSSKGTHTAPNEMFKLNLYVSLYYFTCMSVFSL